MIFFYNYNVFGNITFSLFSTKNPMLQSWYTIYPRNTCHVDLLLKAALWFIKPKSNSSTLRFGKGVLVEGLLSPGDVEKSTKIKYASLHIYIDTYHCIFIFNPLLSFYIIRELNYVLEKHRLVAKLACFIDGHNPKEVNRKTISKI